MINLVACCLNIYVGILFPSIFHDMMMRGTMSQIFYLGPGFCFMLLRKLCLNILQKYFPFFTLNKKQGLKKKNDINKMF